MSPVNYLTQTKAHLPVTAETTLARDIWDVIWGATAVWLWVVVLWKVTR